MTVLTSMACVVTAAGISRPIFADVYETLQAAFQGIYGSDAYIQPDSKDGQMLAIVAKAIDDMNATCVAVYNGFSPGTAQGAALSSNVKINGIARGVATKSTVTVRLSGSVGTVIPEGSIIADGNGVRWVVPQSTITITGFVDTTATAEQAGDLDAPIGSITLIQSPTRGWQTVTNTTTATKGAPVESDAALRRRQASSVSLPSKTVLDGITAAVYALPGVTSVKAYENVTDATDASGLPEHSIAMVVRGGVNTAIADAILRKKTPGGLTHGNQSVVRPDVNGVNMTIKYAIPIARRIFVAITIKALPGYQVAYADQVKEAVKAYINALGSGKRVDLGRIYVPAQLDFAPGSETFEVDAIQLGEFGGPALAVQDIPIAYDEVADVQLADITVTVL